MDRMSSSKAENADKKTFFETMVKAHGPRLYAHIRSVVINHDDADDVLQNTLLKAWAGLDQFRSEAAVYTWLHRIAVNEALQFLRKSRWQRLFIPSFRGNEPQASQSPDSEQILLKLVQGLKQLPPQQRVIFGMRYFDETPYAEIAAVLKISQGAAKASYHQAAKKVEHYLQQNIE